MNTYLPTHGEVVDFLTESNAIERVYDAPSLEQALLAWDFLMERDTLTPEAILEAHRILMLDKLEPRYRGQWRDCAVMIGGYYATSWKYVPGLIQSFCERTMEGKLDAKELHVYFEQIHPFIDGNGRVGRMLYNWTRLVRNQEPLHIIHTGEEQFSYYQWFRKK